MIHVEPHTVYVVIPAGYDEYGISGVYATLEAAQGSVPGQSWTQWDDGKRWSNGGDALYGDTAYIIERWEVTE